jgi:hypothetical protein
MERKVGFPGSLTRGRVAATPIVQPNAVKETKLFLLTGGKKYGMIWLVYRIN